MTTLGRGGSDTTAVAVAAALGADVCEIYTDVAGVFSADPRIVPDARKLRVVSFEEMLEMAASGARCCSCAPSSTPATTACASTAARSFEDAPVPLWSPEQETMEQPLITAVTHSTEEARVTLLGVPDQPGVAGRIFSALAEANVNVDMIIQNEPVSEGARADMSFTVPRADLPAHARHARGAGRRPRHRLGRHRRGDGQGVDHRRRHEVAPRRRGEGVRRARRARASTSR